MSAEKFARVISKHKRWHEILRRLKIKRWHQEVHICKKQAKIRATMCDTRLELGRYRKIDAYDCGNAQCKVCHMQKIYKIETHKDKINKLSFKEQLKEAS